MISHERIQFIVLSFVFLLTAIAVGLIWWPFLKLLAIAAILAILFNPLYKRLSNALKNHTFGAVLTLLMLILILILPVLIVGQLLFSELSGLYGDLRDANISQTQIVEKLPEQLKPLALEFFNDLGKRTTGFIGSAFSSLSQAISSAAGFFLSLFLTFFAVYYFLRDGERIKNFANTILPMSETNENILVNKLSEAISGVVKGSFLVALIQGFVATLGFFIFGIPNPLLWGSLTVLAALVPNVGTSLSLVPAVLYLFLIDRNASAIGLGVWGALAVGLIDNIVSPKLVGAQTKLHPLLVLFSVLGGIGLFGFIGFLLGPIIMAVFVALLDIYRTDLKRYLGK